MAAVAVVAASCGRRGRCVAAVTAVAADVAVAVLVSGFSRLSCMRPYLGLAVLHEHVLVSLECSKRDPTYAACLSTGSGTPMFSAEEHFVAVEMVTESHQQVAHVHKRGDSLSTGCSGNLHAKIEPSTSNSLLCDSTPLDEYILVPYACLACIATYDDERGDHHHLTTQSRREQRRN